MTLLTYSMSQTSRDSPKENTMQNLIQISYLFNKIIPIYVSKWHKIIVSLFEDQCIFWPM